MADYAQDLADYLKGDRDQFIEACALRAQNLVTELIGKTVVPSEIVRLAILETGAKLYSWRDAPNGVANFADYDGAATPIRLGSDPLVTARQILAPYLYKPVIFA